MVSFAITLSQRQTFLLHINTLACVKTEIWPMLWNLHFSYLVAQSERSNVYMFYL